MSIAVSVEPYSASLNDVDKVLARFTFGAPQLYLDTDYETGMPLLQRDERCEVWRVEGNVTRKKVGQAQISMSDHYCLAAIEIPVDMQSYAEVSKLAYDQLFQALHECQQSQIVKTWNYLPDINGGGSGDGEYYKQFCVGRGESYAENGLSGDCMPAGTAVGVSGSEPLRIFVLSSSHEVLPIENPRQTSAYHYPRQYGPKSPSFSRAVSLESKNSRQFFLSGTASITGHLSRHLGLLEEQARETVQNISALVEEANLDVSNSRFCFSEGVFRVHLKDGREVETVRGLLHNQSVNADQMILVQADICRRELLVEVDGLFDAISI